MTGHRKNQGKPLKAVRRAESSWASYQRVMTAATKPGQRVSATADYLRAVLERTDVGIAAASAVTICHALVAEAQRLEAIIVKGGDQQ